MKHTRKGWITVKIKPLSEHDHTLLLHYGFKKGDLPKALHLSFSKGEYLSREGEALKYIYIVVSGKAKVLFGLSDGKQLLLAYFISNGIIGDVELMTNVHTHQATLQAVINFECVAIPLAEYSAVLRGNNKFINHVGCELAKKLVQRVVNGTINTLQPLETRLCAYIMQTAHDGQFSEPLTEVALMVGASYRHLLRCLNKLCDDNILEKQSRSYRIVNRQALMAMSGDMYLLK